MLEASHSGLVQRIANPRPLTGSREFESHRLRPYFFAEIVEFFGIKQLELRTNSFPYSSLAAMVESPRGTNHVQTILSVIACFCAPANYRKHVIVHRQLMQKMDQYDTDSKVLTKYTESRLSLYLGQVIQRCCRQ